MSEQRVAVIADSTCYLPAGWAAELGIDIVPVQVIVAGQSYDETEDVQAQRVAMLGTSMSWFYAAIPLGALMAIPGVLLRHVEQERERP